MKTFPFALLFLCLISPSILLAQEDENFELVKPYERSDLELHLLELAPVYPIPGELVSLGVEVINNQEFPENQLEIRVYQFNQIIEIQHMRIGPLESKSIFFQITAPEVQGIHPYLVEIDSENPWDDVNTGDNSLSFDLLTTFPLEQTDLGIRGLSLVNEPRQVPGILVEIENRGAVSGAFPLEVIVNKTDILRKWIPDLEPSEQKMLFLPYSDVSKIRELSASINPRFSRREENVSDNVLHMDYRPALDLCIEDLFISAPEFNAEEERRMCVNFTIRNNGRQPIRDGFATRIKTSLFDDDDLPETIIHSEGGISPGEAIYVSKEIEGISDEFYIRVTTDIEQQFLEDDEENNIESIYYRNPLPNVRRWYSIGPDKVLNNGLNATGRLYHMAVNPTNGNIIYVGAGSGSWGSGTGVWKTKDGGKTWSPITETLGYQMVNALAIDPKNPSRVILGTPHTHKDSCYLWESLDGGTSWKKMAEIHTELKGKSILVFDPATLNIFLTSKDGIYRSADNGRIWTRILSGEIHDLVLDPVSSGTLYAAYKDNSGFSLYRSQNHGDSGSWSAIAGCGNKMLPAVAEGNMNLAISGSKLFVSYMVDTVFSIYASTKASCSGNQGPKWEKMLEKSIHTKLTSLEADPKDANNLYAYWSGPSSIWVSHDGGKTIKKVGGKAPHVDTHGFGFDPQNSKIVYALSDGGIFKSTDTGKDGTWSFIGEGIRNTEIFHMAGIQSDPETLIAGTQDNGNISKQKHSKDWKEIPKAYGDGSFVAIHPTNKDEFYTMHQHGYTLRKHSQTGVTNIGCGFNPCANQHIFFFTIVPDDPQRLLVYYNDTIWTAKNPSCTVNSKCDKKNGSTFGSSNVWSVLWKTPANSGSVRRMLIDDKQNIFYAGTGSGLVYYSTDRGATFDTAAPLNFRAWVLDMAFNPEKPENIYVSYGKTGTNRIHLLQRYTIGNKFSYSTKDITYGFPSGLEALTLAVDPITPYVVYAGTAKGVYRGQSFDSGNSWIWEDFNKGIAKGTHVSDLEIIEKTGLLRAATKGRSVYSIRNYHDDIKVEIIPISQDIEPGKSFNYSVNVENNGSSSSSFQLSASGLENFQHGFSSKVLTIAPGKQGTTTLSVQVPKCFYHVKWEYIFTVTAQKVNNAQAFSQANALLRIVTPGRQLLPDSQENNNTPSTAKAISVTMNQNAPWNQTPVQVSNLNLHYSLDEDYFKIDFNSNSKAECIGKGPMKFGSFISSFQPKYNPGNITISVKEEFCRPLDVSIFSYDPANPNKAINWGKYKTADAITITCPSLAFNSSEVYVKIWRSEGDLVKYDLEVTLNPWVITLGRPLYEVGDLRYNLPPHLRDWEPRWRWFDFREQFEIFHERLGELREFENMFTEGQLIKIRADIEIAAGNLEEGEALLNHSQEIFEQMGAASALGDVFRSRANLFASSGNAGEAHELLHAAMDHHMETGNQEGVLADVRQLLTVSEEPESFIQAMHLVNEIYHQTLRETNPALQMETTQLMSEILLLNRNIEGAMAAFIVSQRNGSNAGETAMQGLDEQEGKLLHLLGNQGYKELKSSLSHHPEGILDIETSQFPENY